MDKNTHVVIMAGGVGSRLWPASTPKTPKQFVDVLGVGKTLIQLTADRFSDVCPVQNFWVVTSEAYVVTVKAQLPWIPEDHILAEPEARNTAPCIAYSCWKIISGYPDANIVVTPADALVLDKPAFVQTISAALDFSVREEAVVTVGIVPSRPETGYGYIMPVPAGRGEVTPVRAFREKPDAATAEKYLAAGTYFWNAGIFVSRASVLVRQFRKHAPGIAGVMDRLSPFLNTENETEALKELFPQCEKISVDYAVMEKSSDIHMIAADFGWSDLGSWGAVGTFIPKDENGNAVAGEDVRLFHCHNCVVSLPSAKTAVIEGLDGYVVAESAGSILVCRLSEEQHIREYSARR